MESINLIDIIEYVKKLKKENKEDLQDIKIAFLRNYTVEKNIPYIEYFLMNL